MDSDRSKTEVRDDDLDDDYNPGVYNTIDEAMIRSKSPFSGYRVYMPAKPVSILFTIIQNILIFF